jgi:ribonuclease T2
MAMAEVGPWSGRSHYVLAISWQPGFCETRPGKPECESQTAGRFDADHFTLHGLWPQPRDNIYCNVDPRQVRLDKDRAWLQLDRLALDQATRDELEIVMPGTRSGLHRHEWIKHGTCYNGESAEGYYSDSLGLMGQLNTSGVRTLFANSIGRNISREDIGEAFEAAFGAGTSDRATVSCKRDGSRRLITELLISLHGEIGPDGDLGALMRDAPTRSPGCPNGTVDPVGLQ